MSFIRTKKVKGNLYRYEVENYRDKETGKVRQRTLKYLGKVEEKKKKKKSANFEACTSSKSNEWYTPQWCIDLARKVMGDIDIDPASNVKAQKWIKAKTYYTQTDDGFNRDWRGKLWLNPPYGSKNSKKKIYGTAAWCEKAISEYDAGNVSEAILLTGGNNKGTRALSERFIRCEPSKRIRFIDEQGIEQKNPPPAPNFYYLGTNEEKFKKAFSKIGQLVKAV